MALKKPAEFMGVNFLNAYYRISNIKNLNKSNGIATIVGYTDKNQDEGFWSNEYAFIYDLNGENPIKQAYEFIKQQPEFVGAQDC